MDLFSLTLCAKAKCQVTLNWVPESSDVRMEPGIRKSERDQWAGDYMWQSPSPGPSIYLPRSSHMNIIKSSFPRLESDWFCIEWHRVHLHLGYLYPTPPWQIVHDSYRYLYVCAETQPQHLCEPAQTNFILVCCIIMR